MVVLEMVKCFWSSMFVRLLQQSSLLLNFETVVMKMMASCHDYFHYYSLQKKQEHLYVLHSYYCLLLMMQMQTHWTVYLD